MASDNTSIAARAEAHLGHEARLDKTIALPVGHIEVWRSARRRPSKAAPFFVSPEGEPFRVNASWKSFERMLKAARPDLQQTDLLTRLVSYAPGRRVVATQDFDVPAQYRSTDWAPRASADGSWTAHAVDTIGGRWERLRIGRDYSVELTDLGPAPKIGIR